ncbi:MAG: hypothetical protein GY906_23845 [bacterium]|nr:hypothetical protein [bacterium]
MIDRKEAEKIRRRINTHEEWLHVTNEEKSACEQFEFAHSKPERYFLYVNQQNKLATTWMGDKLGAVTFGRLWRDNFGGTRIPITVLGINGVRYHGTCYTSAGEYVRITAYKNQSNPER